MRRLLTPLAALVAVVTASPFVGASDVKHLAAMTFDDLPPHGEPIACLSEMNHRFVSTMTRQKIPAVVFVNEGALYVKGEADARIDTLREWVEAGLELGNHTFGHTGSESVTLPEYEDDVIRGETVTRMLLSENGRSLRYFRHPALRTGPTDDYREGLSRFLRGRGYTVAPVTIDTQDYMFALVYADARHRGDAPLQKRVADAYRAYTRENLSFHERLAVEVLGREVKHVILLHVNHLNADLLDELLETLAQRNYSFISLEEALADPAFSRPEPTTARGWSWIQRWILATGSEPRPEPREPEWVTIAFKSLLREGR